MQKKCAPAFEEEPDSFGVQGVMHLGQTAAVAAEHFRSMVRDVDRIDLDYSRDSIAHLSWLLAKRRLEWQAMGPAQLNKLIELAGCYYGECIRRLFGGTWEWFGDHAAVRVFGARMQQEHEVHWALPFSNVHSHVTVGEEKSLQTLFVAFEALVHGAR